METSKVISSRITPNGHPEGGAVTCRKLRRPGMRELALFAGVGGGLLASHLLGFTTTHIVEINEWCRRVLAARMKEGLIPNATLHTDIKRFDGNALRGQIDIVSGGFPCQAFSHAAHGNNTAEDLWPEMLRVIDGCRPKYVFAENVQRKPIEKAAHDLSSRGFRTAFTRLSAAGLGAPHRRTRWWLLADSDPDSELRGKEYAQAQGARSLTRPLWASPEESGVLGVLDGVPDRMDRIRALGNAQVPIVAAAAFEHLYDNLNPG